MARPVLVILMTMLLGVGVKPIIADLDLAFIEDVRGHPGNELKIIYRLQLGRLPAPSEKRPLPPPVRGQSVPGQASLTVRG